MSERRRRIWWRLGSAALLAACIAAVATSLAQTSNNKWWPGYGNGPDNSRYFASQQINKSNVNQLQVAWTYPYGDTASGPIVNATGSVTMRPTPFPAAPPAAG